MSRRGRCCCLVSSSELRFWLSRAHTRSLSTKSSQFSAHVHLNQPGRTSWEGFTSGTLAAISGGVTTVIDMPLNSIPSTTSVGALEVKIKAARYGWENWRSLEEAQRRLGGVILPNGEGDLRLKSGMGIGAGWGEGRVTEKYMHEQEDGEGTVEIEDAIPEGQKMIEENEETMDDSDEEMAKEHGMDYAPIRRLSRKSSFSGQRLLDVLGPADSFSAKGKGVYCDVGFWGGIVPGNRVSAPVAAKGMKLR